MVNYLSFRVLQFLNFFFDLHLKHLFHLHLHLLHFSYMFPSFFFHLCKRAPVMNIKDIFKCLKMKSVIQNSETVMKTNEQLYAITKFSPLFFENKLQNKLLIILTPP